MEVKELKNKNKNLRDHTIVETKKGKGMAEYLATTLLF